MGGITAVFEQNNRKIFRVQWTDYPDEDSWKKDHSILKDGYKETIDKFWLQSGLAPKSKVGQTTSGQLCLPGISIPSGRRPQTCCVQTHSQSKVKSRQTKTRTTVSRPRSRYPTVTIYLGVWSLLDLILRIRGLVSGRADM